MHFLFYGEDTFSINEKAKNLIKKFSESHSDLNIFHLDGANMTLENYLETTSTLPFLGTKKLIVINNFLLESRDNDFKKEIAKSLDKIPDISTVLFIERGVPDMRSSLFKALNKPKLVQKFDVSSPMQLGNWIDEKVKEDGGAISPAAKNMLQIFVGGNLWRLKNEIAKLVLFKKSKKSDNLVISPEDVEVMVSAENNSNIFQFIDALGTKNSKTALKILGKLIESGEDPFYIFTMIVYQFRNLLMVAELPDASLNEVAVETKLHPFVVKKSKEILKRYQKEKLSVIYQELQGLDYKIKSGRLDLGVALPFLTVNLCRM